MHTLNGAASTARRNRVEYNACARKKKSINKNIMNDNAELYHKNNSLQRRDAIQSLEKYSGKIKWKKADRIIDIGCGDGSVLHLMKNFIPVQYEEILGCDISEKMIHFANFNNTDSRTKFAVLDIEGKLPEALRENFDHALSFYALHWIMDQETAFRNIYDLLNESGDCLLTFLGHMPLFDVYHALSKNNKWSAWVRNIDRFVSPYHHSKNPVKEITKLLERVGFNDVQVKSEDKEFVYENIADWRKAVEAVNPFHIPADLIDDFIKDLMHTIIDIGLSDFNSENNCKIKVKYNLLTIYANKKNLKGK